MKAIYQKPSAEIVRFENEDIITASGECITISNRYSDPNSCGWISLYNDNNP